MASKSAWINQALAEKNMVRYVNQHMNFPWDITGKWIGENILHDPMTDTQKKSPSKFTVSPILKEMFIELLYEWEYEGEKQEGIITIGYRKNKDECFATWIDTWHMSSDFMLLKGTCKDNE